MNWRRWRRRARLEPDQERFHALLRQSVNAAHYDEAAIARDFRRLFLRDPDLGRRVLFMLMTWCGEYEMEMPEGAEALARFAGKHDISGRIKAALYADLETMPEPETKEDYRP